MTRGIVVLGSILAGCAGDPAPDPEPGIDITSLTCVPQRGQCVVRPVELATFDSERALERRLTGAWLFCGGREDNGRFGAGVELTPAHRFHILEASADGSCARSDRPIDRGDWYVLDISEQNPEGTYQLVLDYDGGTTSLVPTFTGELRGLVDGFAGFRFAALR